MDVSPRPLPSLQSGPLLPPAQHPTASCPGCGEGLRGAPCSGLCLRCQPMGQRGTEGERHHTRWQEPSQAAGGSLWLVLGGSAVQARWVSGPPGPSGKSRNSGCGGWRWGTPWQDRRGQGLGRMGAWGALPPGSSPSSLTWQGHSGAVCPNGAWQGLSTPALYLPVAPTGVWCW